MAGNVFTTIGPGRFKLRLDLVLVSLARVGLLGQVAEAAIGKGSSW